ncbi:MAG: hypothetical protein HUJ74_04280 [Lachnospiraceae bacterium]|nr:hypothetical protein [Lachnospiraceae bacterium]
MFREKVTRKLGIDGICHGRYEIIACLSTDAIAEYMLDFFQVHRAMSWLVSKYLLTFLKPLSK